MQIQLRQPATVEFTASRAIRSVAVSNSSGQICYSREFPDATTAFKINFPRPGVYNVPGSYKISVLPLRKANLPTLPGKERDRMTNQPLRITRANLKGTPARVYTYQRVIVYTPEMEKYDLPTRLFILFHELGHFYYETEWKCDLFAFYWMMRLGYNKSSCVNALIKILKRTPANIDRINKLFSYAK